MHRTYRLKLHANPGKHSKLRQVVTAYHATSQSIANRHWRIFYQRSGSVNIHIHTQSFNKNLDIKQIASPLSERYKQTAQYQVVGVLDSFISNRTNDFACTVIKSSLDETTRHKLLIVNRHGMWQTTAPFCDLKSKLEITAADLTLARAIFRHLLNIHRKPSFKHVNMNLDSKVAVISERRPGQAKKFDYWIRLSTIDKGRPIYLPLTTNEYFEGIQGKVRNFCQVNMADRGTISVSFIKGVPNPTYAPETDKIALDLGLVILFGTDKGDLVGRGIYPVLQKYDAILTALARNRARQGLKVKSPRYNRLVRRLREYLTNEINRVIKRLVDRYHPAEIVVERLNFQNQNLSRRMNRLLSLFGKAIVTRKFADLHEKFGIIINEQNPAYTSQECPVCGYVDKKNRQTRDKFKCKCCNTGLHADVSGARTLRGRSSLTGIDTYTRKKVVLGILTGRFLSGVERIPRLNSRAGSLLPENPYFRGMIPAQPEGFS